MPNIFCCCFVLVFLCFENILDWTSMMSHPADYTIFFCNYLNALRQLLCICVFVFILFPFVFFLWFCIVWFGRQRQNKSFTESRRRLWWKQEPNVCKKEMSKVFVVMYAYTLGIAKEKENKIQRKFTTSEIH